MLLEVLIAFALVVLCALPLISSHVAIYRSQKQFVRKVELDHVVNLLYAKICEELQKNEISWDKIENKYRFTVEPEQLQEINQGKPLPFRGHYHLEIQKFKPKTPAPFSVYLLNLKMQFISLGKPREKPIDYHYQMFVARQLHTATNEGVEKDEKA